jgi:hypothetical protein
MLFTQNPKIGKWWINCRAKARLASASFTQFVSIFYKLYKRSWMPEECDLSSGFRLANLWFT